jgi:acyl carrier protein
MILTDFDIQNRIVAVVSAIMAQNALTASITADTLLMDVGLNSTDMVNLMLRVEAEFDFTIPQSEITPENFSSVQALQRMIANQLQPNGHA